MDDKQVLGTGCCGIEAIVSVDARGQIVLPKDLREQVGIKPGDKLAVVAMRQGEQVCCLSLLKAEAFSGMVKQVMEPIMKDLTEGQQ
jgi:AbrB family looped-hinge helix DNA binding protein